MEVWYRNQRRFLKHVGRAADLLKGRSLARHVVVRLELQCRGEGVECGFRCRFSTPDAN